MFLGITNFFKHLYAGGKCGKAHKLFMLGNYEASKQLYDEALKIGHPDYLLPVLHSTKGQVEFELGNYEEAKASLEIVREDIEKSPEVWNQEKYKNLIDRLNYYWNEIKRIET